MGATRSPTRRPGPRAVPVSGILPHASSHELPLIRGSIVHRRRDALQHSPVRLDDGGGGLGPGEGRGVPIPGPHVRVKMLSQGGLGIEVAGAERLFAKNAEEALHLVEPRRARRRVVEVHPRVRGKPRGHLWGPVRRRIVEHDVQLLSGVATHHRLHEGEKVGRRVAVGHAMRDVARGDLQRRVQVDDAVAFVVVRVARGTAGAQRQRQLRSLERLDRRLLIHTQHHRVLRRVEVQPDDILHLGREVRVATDLVRPHQVGLEAVASKHVRDAACRQAHLLGQQSRRPPATPSRRRRHRELNQTSRRLGRNRVVRATRLGTLCQPRHALGAESRADHRHVFRRQIEAQGDLPPRHPLVAQQNNPCSANQARRLGRPSHDAPQLVPLLVRQLDLDGVSHAPANGQGQDLIPHGRRCNSHFFGERRAKSEAALDEPAQDV